MIGCQGRNWAAQVLGFVFVAPRPEPRDAFWPVEQSFGGGAPQKDQDLRLHQLYLPLDEGQAGGRLGLRRRAVPRWAPVNRIRQVKVASGQSNRRHHAIEELPTHPDEWATVAILIRARRLTDQHHI